MEALIINALEAEGIAAIESEWGTLEEWLVRDWGLSQGEADRMADLLHGSPRWIA